MLIIDDLAKIVFNGLSDYAQRAYLANLRDYLREIRLLYENGKIPEEQFREWESITSARIKELTDQMNLAQESTASINII